MEGLSKFRETFEAYSDNYVIIGGTACDITDGIRHADSAALIALKARAYLNLLQDKANGKHVNTKDIKKHRSDVLKNTVIMEESLVGAPESIVACVKDFVDSIRSEGESLADSLAKSLDRDTPFVEALLDQLYDLFTTEEI